MADNITVYEVGDEIVTECSKCKSETYHVITKMDGDVIKKVMCKGCNTTHVYRDKSVAASKPKAKKANGKAPSRRRRRTKDWESLQADIDESQIVDYQLDRDFSDKVAIRHKQFGIGYIHKVLSPNQIEVVFRDGVKILVHNYRP